MEILSIYDPVFRAYGRVVDNVDLEPLLEALRETPVTEEVVYEPGVAALEAVSTCEQLRRVTYGEMPIQIGYCNGHNSRLNALEYHRDSEINIAATDAVLLLGLKAEVEEDFTYDTAKVKAFLLPAGAAVEVYATTLHYAPCGVDGKGFQVAIVLPKGTNYPLKESHGKGADRHSIEGQKNTALVNEDILLTAVNKWLIGHEEGGLAEGSFLGLKGPNIDIGSMNNRIVKEEGK